MDHIRIYPADIDTVDSDIVNNRARIRIYNDSNVYLCPLDYLQRSLVDRGFVTIRFED